MLSFFIGGVLSVAHRQFYSVLNVSLQASSEQINKAYQVAASKLASSKQMQSTIKRKIKQLQLIKKTLTDPTNRQKYDLYGHDSKLTQNGLIKKGRSHRIKIRLSQEEFKRGEVFTMIAITAQACPRCQGHGVQFFQSMSSCNLCSSTGHIFFKNKTKICPKCQGLGKTGQQDCRQCQGRRLKRVQKKVIINKKWGEVKLINQGKEKMVGSPGDLIIQFLKGK